MRVEHLLSKYVDDFSSCLYRELQNSELCVEIIQKVYADIITSRSRWDDECDFFFHTKAKIYNELAKVLKNNRSLRVQLRDHMAKTHIDLSEIYAEIKHGIYPRKKIAELYYIEEKGPSEIAKILSLNVNTVKYHCKQLAKRVGFSRLP